MKVGCLDNKKAVLLDELLVVTSAVRLGASPVELLAVLSVVALVA